MPPPFVFPSLPGLTWPVTKTPTSQTRLRRALSGREERSADYLPQSIPGVINITTAVILWQFELSFEFLRGSAGAVRPADVSNIRGPYTGAGYFEANMLHGFVSETRGPFYPFFYDDIIDNTVIRGGVAVVGDNVTKSFQLLRFFGDPSGVTPGFYEPVTAPRVVSAVYINNVAIPGSYWSVDKTTGILSFVSAPTTTQTITADFTFWHRCRFTDDIPAGFDEFMYLLHSVKSLKFLTALGDHTGAPS